MDYVFDCGAIRLDEVAPDSGVGAIAYGIASSRELTGAPEAEDDKPSVRGIAPAELLSSAVTLPAFSIVPVVVGSVLAAAVIALA